MILVVQNASAGSRLRVAARSGERDEALRQLELSESMRRQAVAILKPIADLALEPAARLAIRDALVVLDGRGSQSLTPPPSA